MFSLPTWVSNVDLDNNIISTIDGIDQAKKDYNTRQLKALCDRYLQINYTGLYTIYTDASITNNEIGVAFFDSFMNASMKLKVDSVISIMHAELIAILEALSYIDSIACSEFLIISDCRSALQLLRRCTLPKRGISIAYVILDLICKLKSKNKNVVIQWVPSHIGIEGNETVDQFAKEASTDGEKYSCVPYYTELYCRLKHLCYDSWQEYFNERSRSKGIWYATIQPNVLKSTWIDSANMGRQKIITALRLRSGHIPLNKFARLMGKVESPNCVECNLIEDVYHIIMECVRNEPERRDLFMVFNSMCETGVCNSVLAAPASEAARMLYRLVNIGIRRRGSVR